MEELSKLKKMGKDAAFKKLAEHEQAGTLREYVKKIAPRFVCGNEVHKFRLIAALGFDI